jgi:RNA polymerase sigma-70 factor (ECF subfamily)
MLPDDPEVRGLLAMMLLHDSRREARFRDGQTVTVDGTTGIVEPG